jgi:putative glutamine amidotransferase
LKPIIGISSVWSAETWSSDENKVGCIYIGKQYVDAILYSGGTPFILPMINERELLIPLIEDIMMVIDGLLLSGGGSLEGILSQTTRPTLTEQQPKRYEFEKELLLHARMKGMPILGICRGCQMIAEVFGGKMDYSHFLQGHRQKESGDHPTHNVRITDNTKAKLLLQAENMLVNSFHVQSIETVPEGFIASGISDDGVIEIIESTLDPFVVGVQFHPEEMLLSSELAKRIIDLFVESARDFKKTRS